MNIQSDKKSLRATLRAQRLALSASEKETCAHQVATHVSQSSLFQKAQHIALYHPIQSELDPTPLCEIAWQLNKQVYLPVVNKAEKRLHFYAFTRTSILISQHWEIPEPVIDSHSTEYPADLLDLVCTPLVAFDRMGFRLGMGAGFYDRSFAFLNNAPSKRPNLIGLAYAFQERHELLHDSWDIPLDAVVTEKEIIVI